MTEVEIRGDTLVVRLTGFLGLVMWPSRLTVPLSAVREAGPGQRIADAGSGGHFRGMMIFVPWLISVGSFVQRGRRVFWSVVGRDRSNTVVVELTGQKYARLVLQVADPGAVLDALAGARVPVVR
ncbi:hypothetical protein [Actinophytocola gossypii]|uniref:PH domain-containing protein n=1 Tax=Actinophytocola gossypii TaxID=2812003 RepID=A0ABT2JA41_9PSEU|nr:hypothetical protein [Actinophytocola gossypii]MCT2584744.1 hypothetical protein [Actinophytocola gossypii]